MSAYKSLIVCVSALLAAGVTVAPAALAHSFPEEETPSPGQRLSAPPSEVTIKFDAPIERVFAKLEVLNTDGKPETAGPAQVDPSALTLSVKVAALKPGDYTVKWGVVCIDSHHTEGSYVFTVLSGG